MNNYIYANNNPVNRIDPSGEFSLVQATVSMTIYGVLVSEAYKTSAHFASDLSPIEWKGTIGLAIANYPTGTVPILSYAFGGLIFNLSTKDNSGNLVKANILVTGIGFGVGTTPLSASVSAVTFSTPGIFGYDPDVFSGPAYYSSISRTIGPFLGIGVGGSYGRTVVGMGESNADIGLLFGFDIGIDFITGWANVID